MAARRDSALNVSQAPGSPTKHERMNTAIIVRKVVDMDSSMIEHATGLAVYAIDACPTDREVATYIKEKFEAKYEKYWHCIVGRNFVTYVTHTKGAYCYFYIGQMGFCLWKTP